MRSIQKTKHIDGIHSIKEMKEHDERRHNENHFKQTGKRK